MITNLNGNWKGIIIYGPEYRNLENKELYFSLEIKQEEETFTGTAIDTSGIGTNPDIAEVRGFIEANEISFVKQYKSTLWFDENYSVIIEKDKLGPEINYWGTFDPLTGTMEGNWEIVVDSQQIGQGYLDNICTGTWTMRKE
ncbi:MAG: hypothetical protein V4547_08035 [Bacteroidota bacterium]